MLPKGTTRYREERQLWRDIWLVARHALSLNSVHRSILQENPPYKEIFKMSVDVIPLGNPELGMSRAEILDYANTMLEFFFSSVELFYTVLFAYVIAMYLAGSQLTKVQYVIANIMYLMVVGFTVFSKAVLLSGFYAGANASGLEVMSAGGNWWLYQVVITDSLLIGLSIWFGRRVRHPKME